VYVISGTRLTRRDAHFRREPSNSAARPERSRTCNWMTRFRAFPAFSPAEHSSNTQYSRSHFIPINRYSRSDNLCSNSARAAGQNNMDQIVPGHPPLYTAISPTPTQSTCFGSPLLKDEDASLQDEPPKKKQKRNKPTLSCFECVERKTKVSQMLFNGSGTCLRPRLETSRTF